jgi:hypothetical protein
MSEARIKALEDFVVQMRAFTEQVSAFMEAQANVTDAQASAAQSVGQTMAVFAEHIDGLEGAVMKLIRIVDPDGAGQHLPPDATKQ